MYCDECGNILPPGADRCPYCDAAVGSGRKKKKSNAGIVALLAFCVAAMVMAAWFLFSTPDQGNGFSQTASTAPQSKDSQTVPAVSQPIGAAASFDEIVAEWNIGHLIEEPYVQDGFGYTKLLASFPGNGAELSYAALVDVVYQENSNLYWDELTLFIFAQDESQRTEANVQVQAILDWFDYEYAQGSIFREDWEQTQVLRIYPSGDPRSRQAWGDALQSVTHPEVKEKLSLLAGACDTAAEEESRLRRLGFVGVGDAPNAPGDFWEMAEKYGVADHVFYVDGSISSTHEQSYYLGFSGNDPENGMPRVEVVRLTRKKGTDEVVWLDFQLFYKTSSADPLDDLWEDMQASVEQWNALGDFVSSTAMDFRSEDGLLVCTIQLVDLQNASTRQTLYEANLLASPNGLSYDGIGANLLSQGYLKAQGGK